MAFNSVQYFLFLPTLFLIFYFTRDNVRWLILLLASVSFYAILNAPHLLIILFLVIGITFCCGILIEASKTPKQKKLLLGCGVGTNLCILVILKYTFLLKTLNVLLSGALVNIPLTGSHAFISIGVSFYVFQAVSYLTDIYWGIGQVERHVGYLALYLAFFPKLLQGPIERANSLLPQLRAKYEFNYDNMRSGLLLFTWGLFKKVVVADRLELFVNAVYADVHSYTGLPLILASYFYAIQLYLDFSGYTDMALGSARIFNIKLTQNFNNPYLATSVSDFWRRWHISFSTWLRDYLYIPLGGNRVSRWRRGAILLIVFLICGLWHGGTWGYVVWGLLHGTYLTVSIYYRPFKKAIYLKTGLAETRIQKIWQTLVTFNLVCFAWVFFRASTISDAFYVISHSSVSLGYNLAYTLTKDFLSTIFLLGWSKGDFVIASFGIAIVTFIDIIRKNTEIEHLLVTRPIWLRWATYYGIIFAILILGLFDRSQFLYFQF